MYYLNTRIYIKLMFYECQDLLLGNSRSWNVVFANDLTSLAIYDLSSGRKSVRGMQKDRITSKRTREGNVYECVWGGRSILLSY